MKRSKLRRVSSKRKKELALYAKAKELWRQARRGKDGFLRCQITNIRWKPNLGYFNWDANGRCMAHAMDSPHHRRGRLGKRLYDRRSFVATCFYHHRWIHDHPKEARKMGLLK